MAPVFGLWRSGITRLLCAVWRCLGPSRAICFDFFPLFVPFLVHFAFLGSILGAFSAKFDVHFSICGCIFRWLGGRSFLFFVISSSLFVLFPFLHLTTRLDGAKASSCQDWLEGGHHWFGTCRPCGGRWVEPHGSYCYCLWARWSPWRFDDVRRAQYEDRQGWNFEALRPMPPAL